MYLSRLEMVGFKSFGLKTDLAFNDGVTAIVGPNGCGKTNIVDAIRWVLGEQKTSMLRADSMEHVIFNGSKTRKPLGMAEVSLTIENNRQILPTEYSQVVITRRLFRDGESQYLLNKTQCRLRDIVDLFMDTGMGADAYSVIELKMIETILSDKADERRHLFEEAAGVTKYKARRKEAQRKLEAAQRDIARVQDIVREVQKTVNSLSRQAEKARQHQDLSTRLRELDKLLFAFEYADEYIRLKQLEALVAEIRTRRESAETLYTESEQAVQQHEQAHEGADRDLRASMDIETETRSVVESAKQHALLLDERLLSNQRATERLTQEQSESASQQSTTSEELQSVRLRLEAVRKDLTESAEQANQRKQLNAEASAAYQQVRSELSSHRDSLSSAQYALSQQRTQADRYRIQAEAQERRIADTEGQLHTLADRALQVEQQIEKEGHGLDPLNKALQQAESALHSAEARQNVLRIEQERLQNESNKLRSNVAHSNASLEFLVGLVDTNESSKFLLSTSEWSPSGEKLTLAEVIDAPEELRIAIEASLGDAARFFVVADKREADEAIKALSRNNVGKATFLCRDSIPSIGTPPSLGDIPGVIGYASELVSCDDQLRGAIRGILGHTVIVNEIHDAWRVIEQSSAHSAVTMNGEIVQKMGSVRGGSKTSTEGVRVGRKERIERLRHEIAEIAAQLESTDRGIEETKLELSTIDLRVLGEEVRKTAVERNEVQQRLEALRGRMEDLTGQRSALQNEIEMWTKEKETATQLAGETEHSITSIAEGIAQLERDLHAFHQSVQESEQKVIESAAEFNAANILVVRMDSERQALESDEARLSNQRLTIDQRREQRESESISLVKQKNELEVERQGALQKVELLQEQLVQARAQREKLEQTLTEVTTALHLAAEVVRQQRKVVDSIVGEGHDADLKYAEVRLKIDSLLRRATEELEIEPESVPVRPETDRHSEDIRSESQEVRRRLTAMGNVNFLALEEHERENERFQFLTVQLDDLVSSERTLAETIAEINRTARDKFTTTFTRIRENFVMLFKVLFSEDDEADLQMIETEDHDPLECKIDIIAKPRGKRPHSIEMLSGGEKTLTAIALLFSIYLVKPSPFCILDEVDAPLDDANIDRYLKIIRKFSENTQFLMITHNKRTMEAADTLYGVTMEEPAVSKVVSVQLTEERNAA